jgi:hypothetical protein
MSHASKEGCGIFGNGLDQWIPFDRNLAGKQP